MPEPRPEPSVIDLQPVGRRSANPAVRVGGTDRIPLAIGALIGGFLLLALAKPWGAISSLPPAFPSTSVAPSLAAVAAARTPEPASLLSLREHCQEPLGWRAYSREGRNGRALRAWYSVDPTAQAAGPLDPGIPSVQLGPGIDALGYCSPWSGTELPPDDAIVRAWRLEAAPGKATVLGLQSIAPIVPTILGNLYVVRDDGTRAETRASTVTAGTSGWPAGRYVFALTADDWQRWWAVDIAAASEDPMPTARSSNEPTARIGPGGDALR